MSVRSRAAAGRQMSGWQITGWILGVAILVGVLFLADYGLPSVDNSTVVPPPEPGDRAAVVAELARATAAQGICYAWSLNSSPRSTGSNLGDGWGVDDQSLCPRWLKVTATVVYTSQLSEAEDSADVHITAGGLTGTIPNAVELERFGITKAAFMEEPGDTISRAVLTLPLLAYEHRLAPAVPMPGLTSASASPFTSASPSAAVTPTPAPSTAPADAGDLVSASGDLWRDRGPVLLFAGLSLTVGLGVAIWTGLTMRRRAARAAERARRAADRAAVKAATRKAVKARRARAGPTRPNPTGAKATAARAKAAAARAKATGTQAKVTGTQAKATAPPGKATAPRAKKAAPRDKATTTRDEATELPTDTVETATEPTATRAKTASVEATAESGPALSAEAASQPSTPDKTTDDDAPGTSDGTPSTRRRADQESE